MALSRPITPPNTISEADCDARLALNRNDVSALVAKADHRRDGRDNRAANAYYTAAIQVAASMASPSSQTIAQISHAQTAVAWLAEQFKQHLMDALTAAGYPRESQHPRFRQSLDMMLGVIERPPETHQYPQNPQMHYYPGTNYLQFADTREYHWVPKLEGQFPALQQEAKALLANRAGFTPYLQAETNRRRVIFMGWWKILTGARYIFGRTARRSKSI